MSARQSCPFAFSDQQRISVDLCYYTLLVLQPSVDKKPDQDYVAVDRACC